MGACSQAMFRDPPSHPSRTLHRARLFYALKTRKIPTRTAPSPAGLNVSSSSATPDHDSTQSLEFTFTPTRKHIAALLRRRARLSLATRFVCSRLFVRSRPALRCVALSPLSLSHAKLSAFYLQLSQQLGAGLTLAQSLAARSPAPAADCARLVRLIHDGEIVAKVFTAAGNWLPEEDRPFLAAAAATGRLPLILRTLSARHAHLGTLQRRVAFSCLYPLGVLHFGSLVFALFRLINWETGIHWSTPGFIGGVLMILLPFWGSVIGLAVLMRRRNPIAATFLSLLPAIGGYRREQALADFAFALGNLLEAGAPIADAWHSAGEIANSTRIAAAAAAVHAQILRGGAPGAVINSQRVFPPDFVTLYQTGEVTGSLDKNLIHLAEIHQDRARQKLAFAAVLYPGLLFFAVAALVLSIVISAYSGYIGNINKMLDGM